MQQETKYNWPVESESESTAQETKYNWQVLSLMEKETKCKWPV